MYFFFAYFFAFATIFYQFKVISSRQLKDSLAPSNYFWLALLSS